MYCIIIRKLWDCKGKKEIFETIFYRTVPFAAGPAASILAATSPLSKEKRFFPLA